MLICMSRAFHDTLGLDRDCKAKAAADPVSHDNIYSTVLGMLEVTMTRKDAALDLVGARRLVTG